MMPDLYFACVVRMALLVVVLWPMSAPAKDAILEKSFFRDETRELSLADVQGKVFTRYDGLLNQGFHPNVAYWIKLKIRADNPDALPSVLQIKPNWHDDIRLLDPADQRQVPRITGDRTKWSAGEFPSLSHGFLLKKTPFDRDVYVRVESVHSYLLELRALEQSEAAASDWKMLAIYISYVGVVGMVFLWAAVSFMFRPDPVIGTFGLLQFSTLCFCLFPFGLLRIFLDEFASPFWMDLLTTKIIFINTFIGLIFHRTLLGQYSPSRWFLVPLNILIVGGVVGMGLFAWGEATRGLQLNSSGLFAFCFVMLLTAWFGLAKTSSTASYLLPRWTIRMFYTVFFFIVFVGVTPLLGLAQAKEASLNIILVHSAVTTVAMGALLFYRARKIHDRQIKKFVLTQQKVKLERQARLQQNQFMNMLNHEIKTPLSVLKLLVTDSPQRAVADEHIDAITALLDRCLLGDRIDAGQMGQKTPYVPADVVATAIQKTGKTSRFEVGELSPGTLIGDSELFYVCIANLLDNALKYAPPETAIPVSLIRELEGGRPHLCFSVCNQIGRAGVPDPERVFEKYYRSESARSVPGTGLGLYLVKSLVNRMGGEISVRTLHGHPKMVCFQLCLPL